MLTKENQEKGNRTPFEYLNGANENIMWHNFVGWVTSNKKYRSAKRNRLLKKDFGEDEEQSFRERNLNDTRYICRFFKNYVEKYLKLADCDKVKRCVVVNGSILFIAGSTCDPGLDNLLKPVNNNGCAIVMNGYWRDLWKIGLHKGQYKALVQNARVVVFRDNDKDSQLDYANITNDDPRVVRWDSDKDKKIIIEGGQSYLIERGSFGINCHRASEHKLIAKIGLYSAGCCVIQDSTKFVKMISIVENKLHELNLSTVDAYYITETQLNSL